eukprot:11985092-Alexandrium_andersonii.AAC.1
MRVKKRKWPQSAMLYGTAQATAQRRPADCHWFCSDELRALGGVSSPTYKGEQVVGVCVLPTCCANLEITKKLAGHVVAYMFPASSS